MLERKPTKIPQESLFSIPVSSKAETDRQEAWNALELGRNGGRGGFFDTQQCEFAKKLMRAYYDAPQIEKLVMWEVVRSRMDYWMAGGSRGGLGETGSAEILLRREMAKLLFSALGMDRKELFDAVDLKRMFSDDAAERKRASEAEEEIERIHIEQSKVAEKILEQHWKLPP